MGIFLLLATWAHEYIDVFLNIDGHRTWGAFNKSWRCVILTNLSRHVNEMTAVVVKTFQNFLGSSFLLIRRNVSMATNAILLCGLTSPYQDFIDCRSVFSIIIRKQCVYITKKS